jgi:hypothetical protein
MREREVSERNNDEGEKEKIRKETAEYITSTVVPFHTEHTYGLSLDSLSKASAYSFVLVRTWFRYESISLHYY